jgi:hypothetical protein
MTEARGPLDAYEAQEINAPGTVLHRDKNVARMAIFAMAPMALIALLSTILVAAGADPAAPRMMAILPGLWFLGTLWLMLTKVSVRTVVTNEALEVHWGFAGPKVALSAITHCSVMTPVTGGMPAAQFAMNAWAPKGWVVVRWRDESGKEKTSQFPAGDPARLVEEINRARERVTGLRVAEDTSSEHAAEMEAAAAEADEAVGKLGTRN